MVKSAFEYFKSIYGHRYSEITLEVELSDNEKYWHITISYIDPKEFQMGFFKPTKGYKIFMAVTEHIDYDATGRKNPKNDLDKIYEEFE